MKREISEELINVWSELLYERIGTLQDELTNEDIEKYKYHVMRGIISGFSESLSLLSCLEKGRFKRDYARILLKINRESKKINIEL